MLLESAKEELLYKAPLTATVVTDFLSSYQSLFSQDQNSEAAIPFVYVDQNGVKLVTSVVGEESDNTDGIFALSMAGDGWMEMLAFQDHQN